LLRGEYAVTYLAGGQRRTVCDLCIPRAIHEGWVREDAQIGADSATRIGEGRRRLLERLRTRRPLREGGAFDGAELGESALGGGGGAGNAPAAGELARG